jgi:uncharacterized membrane protein
VEALLRQFASYVALGCDLGSVLCAGFGAAEAVARILLRAGRFQPLDVKKDVFVRFASWILLSLEFALAADIVDTAISPTWDAIGRLAAIAVIRTFLNYFIERDLETVLRRRGEG